MDSHETETSRKRGRYNFLKCDQCRKDKQKCLPANRQPPQKCNRCETKGFECSSGKTAAVAKQTGTESTLEDFTFQHRLENFLSAWQWYTKLVQLPFAIESGKRQKMDITIAKLSEKLSVELTQLYQKARDSKDVAAKALLGHLCCDKAAQFNSDYTFRAYPKSEEFGNVQKVATSAITNAFLTPKDPSTSTLSNILKFVEVMWDSGDTERCLETLHNQISGHLLKRTDPNEDWNEKILLTKKFIDYSERSGNINAQLFKDNYLNMAEDIPELEATINMRQHLSAATLDRNTSFLTWLVQHKSQHREPTDARGDTLLHLACKFVGYEISTPVSVKAANVLLDSHPGLEINQQNFVGETALHILCASIGHSQQIEAKTPASYLATLRRFLVNRSIDVDIRDFAEHGNGKVASWYLVRKWYSLAPDQRYRITPFLQCFKELHPTHVLASDRGVWSGL